jgi:hypothetical protein
VTSLPVRLDRLQAGLVAWARTMLPDATVVWGPSEYPRESGRRQLVAIRMLTGPSDAPLGGAAAPTMILPIAATWRAPVPGDTVGLRLSGRAWEYQLLAGDDPTDARDALLAVVLDAAGVGPLVSATFEAAGTDEITIAGTELGDLYQISAYGTQCEVVIDDDVVAQVQVSEATSLVEVQCFGTREPRNGAAAMMSRLLSRLSLPIARDIFERFGLTLNPVGAPASIDALSGPQWESRSALTLQVTQVQLAAEPVEVVEVVRGTIEARSELPVVYEIPFESEV